MITYHQMYKAKYIFSKMKHMKWNEIRHKNENTHEIHSDKLGHWNYFKIMNKMQRKGGYTFFHNPQNLCP